MSESSPSSKVTPSLLADIQTPRDVRISPSGKHIVYSLRSCWVRQGETKSGDATIASSIWVAEVGKPNSARRLTPEGCNSSSPSFSPDGKSIAFLSDWASPGGASHLFSINADSLDDEEYRAIADPSLKQGVMDYKWSPDSSQVAFISFDESISEQAKRAEAKDDAKVFGKDISHGRLRVVEAHTRKVTTLFDGDTHVACLTWSPDAKEIAFLTMATPTMEDFFDGIWTVRILNLESKTTSTICDFSGSMMNLTWRLSETGVGELLWYGASRPGSGDGIYYVPVPAADRRSHSDLKPQYLAYGIDSTAEGLRLTNSGKDVLAYIQNGLSDEIHLLPPPSSREGSARVLYASKFDISNRFDAHMNGQRGTLVCIKPSLGAFEEVFSIDLSTSPPAETQITSHNGAFASFANASASTSIHASAADGTSLNGVFYTPGAAYSAPYPLVVNIHGGPLYRATHGTNIHFEWTEYLLSLGYAVLLPNYRGNPARGAAFAEATLGNPDVGYEDVMAVVKQVVKDYGGMGVVDTQRMAVAGYSWGGYMTNFIVTRQAARGNRDGFRFKCAISGAGISCLQSLVFTTDASHWMRAMVGGAPWDLGDGSSQRQDQSNVWYRASPIHHVKNVDVPILLLQPEEDERIPKEQAVGFYRGMVASGKKELIELVMYPREGHGAPVPWEKAHYEDMLTRVGEFIGTHV